MAQEHDRPFGVIWKEWSGSGEKRKMYQKSLGFNSRHQFVRYLEVLTRNVNLNNFEGGWRPEGPLSPEELNTMTGFVPKE